MSNYEVSNYLMKIADELMDTNDKFSHLRDYGCRIVYLMSDQPKKSAGRSVYADTEKVKDKYKCFSPYDFVITFYQPNCAGLEEEHLKRLMFHELLHIGFDEDGNCSIIPHDVEDFREVIGNWGMNWLYE